MDKQFHHRIGIIAALVIGTPAISSAPSCAATTGGSHSGGSTGGSSSSGGGSGPSGSHGSPSGNHGGDGVSALVIVTGNCPPGIAAGNCRGNRRPPIVRIRERAVPGSHCEIHDWRHVILADGTIVEDRRLPMRKSCEILHDDD